MTDQPPATAVAKSGVEVHLGALDPKSVMSYGGQLELVYCSAFGAAPWFESTRQARRFLLQLLDHTTSKGFRLVTATVERRVVGLGYGRIALSVNEPIDECYEPLIQWVGPELSHSLLYEAFELTELAVVHSWQGKGVGALLHDHLLAAAHSSRAWLLTHPEADEAGALYRSRGWTAVTDIKTAADGARRILMSR